MNLCEKHNLITDTICCQENCLQLYCIECFRQHKENHYFGVLLNKYSQEALLKWNQLLLVIFGQLNANLKIKGYTVFFQMKILPQYPKLLMSQISSSQINQIILTQLQRQLLALQDNIHFIDKNRDNLSQLTYPAILKDLYVLFIFDTSKILSFLLENIQKSLREKYVEKKIYQFVYFGFNGKQLRIVEEKRKEFLKKYQNYVIVKLKFKNIPYSPSFRNRNKDQSSPERNEKSYDEGLLSQFSGTNKFFSGKKQQKFKTLPNSTTLSAFHSPQKINQLQNFQQISNQEIFTTPTQIISQKNQPQHPTNQQYTTILSQLNTLKSQQSQKQESSKLQLQHLQTELHQKQKSINYLNKLINNQQQQIMYRQNQVDMLKQQLQKYSFYKQEFQKSQQTITALKQQLSFRQKSIKELNKLINNQEEQLIYRQNQVEILNEEIKKLLSMKQEFEKKDKQIQQYKILVDKIGLVQNFEDLIERFRESESERKRLSIQHAKICNHQKFLMNKVDQLENQSKQLKNRCLEAQKQLLQKQQENIRQQQNLYQPQQSLEQKINQQLMQQVIEFQAQLKNKDKDIKILINLIYQNEQYIPQQNKQQFLKKLQNLNSLKFTTNKSK